MTFSARQDDDGATYLERPFYMTDYQSTPRKRLGFPYVLGKKGLSTRIALVTSMWDSEDQRTGQARVSFRFRRPWLETDSSMYRYDGTRASALQIVSSLSSGKLLEPLQIQRELVDKTRLLDQAEADRARKPSRKPSRSTPAPSPLETESMSPSGFQERLRRVPLLKPRFEADTLIETSQKQDKKFENDREWLKYDMQFALRHALRHNKLELAQQLTHELQDMERQLQSLDQENQQMLIGHRNLPEVATQENQDNRVQLDLEWEGMTSSGEQGESEHARIQSESIRNRGNGYYYHSPKQRNMLRGK